MSIQPVNKAAEHLITSTPVLEKEKKKKKKERKAVNPYLMKSSRKDWAEYMSQSILCNYFKVCTKFTLEGAE